MSSQDNNGNESRLVPRDKQYTIQWYPASQIIWKEKKLRELCQVARNTRIPGMFGGEGLGTPGATT